MCGCCMQPLAAISCVTSDSVTCWLLLRHTATAAAAGAGLPSYPKLRVLPHTPLNCLCQVFQGLAVLLELVATQRNVVLQLCLHNNKEALQTCAEHMRGGWLQPCNTCALLVHFQLQQACPLPAYVTIPQAL